MSYKDCNGNYISEHSVVSLRGNLYAVEGFDTSMECCVKLRNGCVCNQAAPEELECVDKVIIKQLPIDITVKEKATFLKLSHLVEYAELNNTWDLIWDDFYSITKDIFSEVTWYDPDTTYEEAIRARYNSIKAYITTGDKNQ